MENNLSNMVPYIRDYINFYRNKDELIFVNNRTAIKKTYEFDENFLLLIKNIDGKTTSLNLWTQHFQNLDINYDDINEGLIYLYKDQIISFRESINHLDFEEKYDRQIKFFDNIGLKGETSQRKLERSSVIIVGAGGTGSWVSTLLTKANIGEIYIFDDDIVEETNLPRQINYTELDISRKKVDVLKEKLKIINNEVLIHAIDKKITNESDLISYIKKTDLVISCGDYPSTSELGTIIANVCEKFKVPHIVGGGYSFQDGFMGYSVIPNKTKPFSEFLKYRESKMIAFDEYELIKETTSTSNMGSLGAITSMISSFITFEAIKILTDDNTLLLSNSEVVFNFKKGIKTTTLGG